MVITECVEYKRIISLQKKERRKYTKREKYARKKVSKLGCQLWLTWWNHSTQTYHYQIYKKGTDECIAGKSYNLNLNDIEEWVNNNKKNKTKG